MMRPSGFDEANATLGPPRGVSEAEVGSLRVYRGEGMVISCFKPDAEELAEINRTGCVWLIVQGPTMPPVSLTGIHPWTSQPA